MCLSVYFSLFLPFHVTSLRELLPGLSIEIRSAFNRAWTSTASSRASISRHAQTFDSQARFKSIARGEPAWTNKKENRNGTERNETEKKKNEKVFTGNFESVPQDRRVTTMLVGRACATKRTRSLSSAVPERPERRVGVLHSSVSWRVPRFRGKSSERFRCADYNESVVWSCSRGR